MIIQIEQAYRAGETKVHFQNGKRLGLLAVGFVALRPRRLPNKLVVPSVLLLAISYC